MKLSQRINIIFISFSVAVGIANLAYMLILNESFGQSVLGTNIIITLCTTAFFIAVHGRFHRIRTGAHVLYLFVLGAVIIFDPYYAPFGFVFAVAGLYLAYKYGFLDTHATPKVIAISTLLFTLVLVSTNFSVGWARGLVFVTFALFFYAIMYTGEWEVITKQRQYKKNVEKAMDEIAGERNNLEEMGFTHRELEIGKLLLETKCPDKELAWKLGLSLNTMRNHLRSMRIKTRAASRQELIDSIRWYCQTVEIISEPAPASANLHVKTHTFPPKGKGPL